MVIKDEAPSVKNLKDNAALDLAKARTELNYLQNPDVRAATLGPLEDAVRTARQKLASLKDEHRVKRAEAQSRIDSLEAKLAGLHEQQDLTSKDIKRLQVREELVAGELEERQSTLDGLKDSRARVLSASGSSTDAMALMVVTAQIDRAQQALADLRQRKAVEIPAEAAKLNARIKDQQRQEKLVKTDIMNAKDKLTKMDADYKRAVSDAKASVQASEQTLAKKKADLNREKDARERAVKRAQTASEEIQPTRARFVASVSPKPTGVGRSVIIALGLILGLILGVLAAFVAEFLSHARQVGAGQVSPQ